MPLDNLMRTTIAGLRDDHPAGCWAHRIAQAVAQPLDLVHPAPIFTHAQYLLAVTSINYNMWTPPAALHTSIQLSVLDVAKLLQAKFGIEAVSRAEDSFAASIILSPNFPSPKTFCDNRARDGPSFHPAELIVMFARWVCMWCCL